VRGRYYDGQRAQAHEVEVVADPSTKDLILSLAGGDLRWPVAGLAVERLGPQVRLSWPGEDARLALSAYDWRLLSVAAGAPRGFRTRAGERRLVLGLAAGALAMAGLVFFGVPAASGPLARATPPGFERSIGESFESQLNLAWRSCEGAAGQQALRGLGERLQGNDPGPFPIRVQAVEAPFVNAFALPGGAVIVTDDLIAQARSPDELAAVLAHEVAHVRQRHVMQAVWRSLGVGLVLDVLLGGGTGAGQQAVLLAANASDLSYSRAAELEADAVGRELLHARGLSSQGMAPFFERLAAEEGTDAEAVRSLISSHPASAERARVSRRQARPGAPALDPAAWRAVKQACASTTEP
jgi:beta-barrel assembly-enhancing protease